MLVSMIGAVVLLAADGGEQADELFAIAVAALEAGRRAAAAAHSAPKNSKNGTGGLPS